MVLQAHDFYEGIRAVIIDKDKQPKWQPADLASVTKKNVNAYFAELEVQKELRFD